MKTFFQRTARALASRTILKNNFIPQRVQVRLLARDTTVGNCQANDKAYRLFDVDGDGDLSPEELAQILTTVGESPGDLNMIFDGMSTDTITDYSAVIQWLGFLIKHVNQKDPLTAEADLIKEFSEYGHQASVISADQLFEWIEDHYPDLDEDTIEHLVDGADIDGDGDINYVEYSKLVCRQILHLDSAPLKKAFETVDTDHSGDLSHEEIISLTGQSKATLEEQLAKIDLDHSGTISFVEFLYGIFKTRGESYLRTAFAEFDTNNSGEISKQELLDWCSKYGDITDNIDSLISGADFNGDGKINYDEFICMVVKKQI